MTTISSCDILNTDTSFDDIADSDITVDDIEITDGEVKKMPESQERGALTEAVYYILLALHTPMHGYGIMQFVKEISKGRVILGAGTLYGAIATLLEKGWIRALSYEAESRKKEYEITDTGREIVGEEMLRLMELIDNGIKVTRGGNQ